MLVEMLCTCDVWEIANKSLQKLFKPHRWIAQKHMLEIATDPAGGYAGYLEHGINPREHTIVLKHMSEILTPYRIVRFRPHTSSSQYKHAHVR